MHEARNRGKYETINTIVSCQHINHASRSANNNFSTALEIGNLTSECGKFINRANNRATTLEGTQEPAGVTILLHDDTQLLTARIQV